MVPIIHIVDDDPTILSALFEVLTDAGLDVRTYEAAEPLLRSIGPDSVGCVLLDLHLPGMDGLATLGALRDRGTTLPVIFLTGHGDVVSVVRAIKAGASDFLEKPVAQDVLIAAVRSACAQESERCMAAIEHHHHAGTVAGPSRREREIAALLLAGVAG
jgi:FixJ family two-component response regulator